MNKLWKSGTYCLYYKDKLILDIAEDLCKKGYCEYSDNLFSEYESNYLSYILDDKKYGNGLKIRNKFSHGKFGYKKEEEHLQNYLELLQIVIFYMMRITVDGLNSVSTAKKWITLIKEISGHEFKSSSKESSAVCEIL